MSPPSKEETERRLIALEMQTTAILKTQEQMLAISMRSEEERKRRVDREKFLEEQREEESDLQEKRDKKLTRHLAVIGIVISAVSVVGALIGSHAH